MLRYEFQFADGALSFSRKCCFPESENLNFVGQRYKLRYSRLASMFTSRLSTRTVDLLQVAVAVYLADRCAPRHYLRQRRVAHQVLRRRLAFLPAMSGSCGSVPRSWRRHFKFLPHFSSARMPRRWTIQQCEGTRIASGRRFPVIAFPITLRVNVSAASARLAYYAACRWRHLA